MARHARHRHRRRHADEDQQRSHQEAAADAEHAGYESDRDSHREYKEDIDRQIGDRKIDLHRSTAGREFVSGPDCEGERITHDVDAPVQRRAEKAKGIYRRNVKVVPTACRSARRSRRATSGARDWLGGDAPPRPAPIRRAEPLPLWRLPAASRGPALRRQAGCRQRLLVEPSRDLVPFLGRLLITAVGRKVNHLNASERFCSMPMPRA